MAWTSIDDEGADESATVRLEESTSSGHPREYCLFSFQYILMGLCDATGLG